MNLTFFNTELHSRSFRFESSKRKRKIERQKTWSKPVEIRVRTDFIGGWTKVWSSLTKDKFCHEIGFCLITDDPENDNAIVILEKGILRGIIRKFPCYFLGLPASVRASLSGSVVSRFVINLLFSRTKLTMKSSFTFGSCFCLHRDNLVSWTLEIPKLIICQIIDRLPIVFSCLWLPKYVMKILFSNSRELILWDVEVPEMN